MLCIAAMISLAWSGLPESRPSARISMFVGFSWPDSRMILIGGQRPHTACAGPRLSRAPGHLDVGEQQRDVRSGFQNCDSFVSIHRERRLLPRSTARIRSSLSSSTRRTTAGEQPMTGADDPAPAFGFSKPGCRPTRPCSVRRPCSVQRSGSAERRS